MIRVMVINTGREQVLQKDFATRELAVEWIKAGESKFLFGVPERWIHEDDLDFSGEDKAQARASKEAGGPDEDKKIYLFPADYNIEIFDICIETESQALSYLQQTDWYVIRQMETGLAIPQDVMALRNAARLKVMK